MSATLTIQEAIDYVREHFAPCEYKPVLGIAWVETFEGGPMIHVPLTFEDGYRGDMVVWLEPQGNDGLPFVYGEW